MNQAIDFDLLLDKPRLASYLADNGLVAERDKLKIEYLGGGVSNKIVRVTTPQRSIVVKQAQPKLQVSVDWFAPVDRVLIEAKTMRFLHSLLPPGTVPEVLYIDSDQFLYAMECVPASAETWKAKLLRGETDVRIATKAGQILGLLHGRTAGDPGIRPMFEDTRILHALRIDPCFTYLAGVHPAAGRMIDEQVERLLNVKLCLVHGDYTPKNMLIDGDRLVLLDYEIAHWGNPALDSGFVLAHLMLKAIHSPQWADGYVQAGMRLWEAYSREFTLASEAELEAATAHILPHLMLARIDSKSPVEYLSAEERKDFARELTGRFIHRPTDKLEDLFQAILDGPGVMA
ncbi:MAG TPA: aminoglycoside phosphotransferase family protein [Anaerolineales bacterium]|nr:aminoglycoside phosphotransferase family protein [Anaerolineales bacterium]